MNRSPSAPAVAFHRPVDRAAELRGAPGAVRFLELPPRRCVMIDGDGPAGPAAFEPRMPGLYATAWTLRFALKGRGVVTKVGPLEGLWWTADESTDLDTIFGPDRGTWRWTLLIVLPDEASAEELDAALETGRGKLADPHRANLRIEVFDEGRVAQLVHVGPYAEERASIERLHAAVAEAGLRLRGRRRRSASGRSCASPSPDVARDATERPPRRAGRPLTGAEAPRERESGPLGLSRTRCDMLTMDRPVETIRTAPNEAEAPDITCRVRSLDLPVVSGDEPFIDRVVDRPLSFATFRSLQEAARFLGVTREFREVVTHFRTPPGQTPAGFRVEMQLERDGLLQFDLVRDIAYDTNGVLRPTNVLFSADTANPYELAPVANLVANLTCNPGIVYDLFLNDPKANVGHRFTNRDEVFHEIGRILGPGSDITVELNDPFADLDHVLEEAEHFREILSRWRVVIKVPHTGPVNAANVGQLLEGDKRLATRFDQPSTKDAFYPHNLALALREHGFRINFTLMFEPHQTLLALQAKPYFINTFVRHRKVQSAAMRDLIDAWRDDRDDAILERLRTFLIEKDYLAPGDAELPLADCLAMAERIVRYRHFDDPEGSDGLDSARHALRVLRGANLPDTRLIICSMEGEQNYPDIDRLLASDEFADMTGRVVITAEPNYLARFTSANQVISYQRRFMTAARSEPAPAGRAPAG